MKGLINHKNQARLVIHPNMSHSEVIDLCSDDEGKKTTAPGPAPTTQVVINLCSDEEVEVSAADATKKATEDAPQGGTDEDEAKKRSEKRPHSSLTSSSSLAPKLSTPTVRMSLGADAIEAERKARRESTQKRMAARKKATDEKEDESTLSDGEEEGNSSNDYALLTEGAASD